MSRRHRAEKRDHLAGRQVWRRGIEQVHQHCHAGRQKVHCRSIVYGAFDMIASRVGSADPVQTFHEAIDNVKPQRGSAVAPCRWCHLSGADGCSSRSRTGARVPLVDTERTIAFRKYNDNGCPESCWTPRITGRSG